MHACSRDRYLCVCVCVCVCVCACETNIGRERVWPEDVVMGA